MNVAVLTSSRADYGIYLPLIKELSNDSYFQLKIIAFGTHLSRVHGYTIEQITKDGFQVSEEVETLILGDSEESVSTSIGLTVVKFASIWTRLKDQIDIVIALGDRYEMFAAVSASVPFNIPIAHIHGGETTLGAIDNKFRHAISLMSTYHFTSTDLYAEKVGSLIGTKNGIFNAGALSLDNLIDFTFLSIEEFKSTWNIDLSIPTILCTFHPETVSSEYNSQYATTLVKTFDKLKEDYQIVITMPNADTQAMIIREKFTDFISRNERVIGVENFGFKAYFSIMKHCSFLLGNTSSGIIEAASFEKYVINLGNRQKGRARGNNVIDVAINESKIIQVISDIEKKKIFKEGNIYKTEGSSAKKIVKALKNI